MKVYFKILNNNDQSVSDDIHDFFLGYQNELGYNSLTDIKYPSPTESIIFIIHCLKVLIFFILI